MHVADEKYSQILIPFTPITTSYTVLFEFDIIRTIAHRKVAERLFTLYPGYL